VLDIGYVVVIHCSRGSSCSDLMVVGFTTTYAITTDVVSSNLEQCEVYNIMW